MSFPTRNPLMPGVAMGHSMLHGPYMGMGGGVVPPPVGFVPSMMPPMSSLTSRGPTYRGHPDGTVAARGPQPPSKRSNELKGPPVTVFVGNITERAPDMMMRLILNACGPVLNWKRVEGASGSLQAFGFCEFANPDAGLRAIRLLHDYEIADKKLVVKVDTKTQGVLDEFKDTIRKSKGESGVKPGEGENDFLDEGMKAYDKSAAKRIQQTIQDHAQEMTNYQSPAAKQEAREKKMSRQPDRMMMIRDNEVSILEKPADLEDVELETDKKELISREIGKFREIMKRQEEEREVERKQREERDKLDKERREQRREQPPIDARPTIRSSRSHSRSYSPHESSYSNKIRGRMDRRRSRSRSVEALKKTEAEMNREREEEQERKEKKKLERKAQEKEAAYQERLRAWETRERKKCREYDKDRMREREKRLENEREARRLKEFLEDYDDERDDPKYYKGRELARRLAEREREKDQDERDRQREREELIELRQRIMQQGHPDPQGEYERQRAQREELYTPRFYIQPEEPPMVHNIEEPPEVEPLPPPDNTEDISQTSLPEPPPTSTWLQLPDASPVRQPAPSESPPAELAFKPVWVRAPQNLPPEPPIEEGDKRESPKPLSPQGSDVSDGHNFTPAAPDTDGERTMSPKPSELPTKQANKKKRLGVKDVFNMEEDEEVEHKKRRKLPTLSGEGEEKKSQEEKRRHIKSIIDRIPTEKQELFNYRIHWEAVDNSLMEKRIRPWINKKIIEYIGEPEPTLVDFICSKVLAGSSPRAILEDVQMVLDEEAEVFVVKMWRLLIYEIEAKKMGLVK